MIDIYDLLTYKQPTKELFVDFDYKQFLIYIIDYDLKLIIKYTSKYVFPTLDHINQLRDKFSIYRTSLYSKAGVMQMLYNELLGEVYIRDDIYRWRMTLDSSLRNRTYPIYYYEVQGYRFITEQDYINTINNT